MNSTLLIESLGAVVVGVLVALAIRAGYFLRISAYWAEMMEEMRKCTWPTWDELIGSTVLVVVSGGIVGGFTVGVDYICSNIIKAII
jgi:preprotein translocase subunit SecE